MCIVNQCTPRHITSPEHRLAAFYLSQLKSEDYARYIEKRLMSEAQFEEHVERVVPRLDIDLTDRKKLELESVGLEGIIYELPNKESSSSSWLEK